MRSTDRSRYRERSSKDSIPRWFRRAADTLPAHQARAAKDYAYTAISASLRPFPITATTLDTAEQHLVALGGSAGKARAAGWRTALDRLPDEARQRAGLTDALRRPQGVRTVAASAGTFISIEGETEELVARLSSPQISICDAREPLNESYVRAVGRRLEVVATRLLSDGKIDPGATVRELLTVRNQTAYLEHIDRRDEAGDEPVWVAEDLAAVTAAARWVCGPASTEATFAAAQQRARGTPYQMGEERVRAITELLREPNLRRLREIPLLLEAEAEQAALRKGPKWRQAFARDISIAAALMLQTELLLQSQDLIGLEIDDDGMPVPPGYDATKLGKLRFSPRTTSLFARRKERLVNIGMFGPKLFPGRSGEGAITRTLIRMVQRIMARHGLPGATIEVIRDVGAVVLLRQDARQIRRVRALLHLASFKAVRRRYQPFLGGRPVS